MCFIFDLGHVFSCKIKLLNIKYIICRMYKVLNTYFLKGNSVSLQLHTEVVLMSRLVFVRDIDE